MWRWDIYLPGGWICECPFTAHCGCKCVHWAVPVPSIVTFASHIRSSCRLFRLWYLTCCEQNPVLRLVVYLWCELSSITGQACRQFFTKCNVYLQKGSKLPFFKYHRFVRPPDFLALVAISCPKSLRGLVGDWAGSVHCARCARPEISGCARAEHQPPGPLKQRQQATAYLERIHMKLPTSNCLQSTFQYVNFVNDLMRTPLIQRRQSNPPPPRIFFKEVYSPVIPVSDLNARVLLLSTTVHCPGFWPLIFLWDKD